MKEYTKQKELIHGKKYLISRFSVYMSSLSLKTGILRHKETFIGTYEFTKEYYRSKSKWRKYKWMKWMGTLVCIITSICIIMDTTNDNMAIIYDANYRYQRYHLNW